MAQKTRAALASDHNTAFADNTSGDITPATLRQQIGDFRDSVRWHTEAGRQFSDRGALVTWAGSNTPQDGLIYSAGRLDWQGATGATDISDLAGLLPAGDFVYVEHFGWNTTPVTTDMTTAIQAAIDYVDGLGGGEVRFLRPVDYLVSSPINKKPSVRLVGCGSTQFIEPTNFASGKSSAVSRWGTRILADRGATWADSRGVVETIATGTELAVDAGMENVIVDAHEIADHAIVCRGTCGANFTRVGAGWSLIADWICGPEDAGVTQPFTQPKFDNCWCVSTAREHAGSAADYVGGWVFWGDARKAADDGTGYDIFSNANQGAMVGCFARVPTGHGFVFEDSDDFKLYGCTGSIIFHSVDTSTFSVKSANASNNYGPRHHMVMGHQGAITAKAATTTTGRAASSIVVVASRGNGVPVDIETSSAANRDTPRVQVWMTGHDGGLNEQTGGIYGIAPAGAQVRRTANFTLSHGVNTIIPWQAVTWENGEWFSLAEPTRLIVPDGVSYVELAAGVTLETGHGITDGRIELHIIKNGVGGAGTGKQHCELVGGGENVNVSHGIHKVRAGDYFEARVFNINGSTSDLTMTNNVSTWFQIRAY